MRSHLKAKAKGERKRSQSNRLTVSVAAVRLWIHRVCIRLLVTLVVVAACVSNRRTQMDEADGWLIDCCLSVVCFFVFSSSFLVFLRGGGSSRGRDPGETHRRHSDRQ